MSAPIELPKYLIDRDGDSYAKVDGPSDTYEMTACLCGGCSLPSSIRYSYGELVLTDYVSDQITAEQDDVTEQIVERLEFAIGARVDHLGGGMVAISARALDLFLREHDLV